MSNLAKFAPKNWQISPNPNLVQLPPRLSAPSPSSFRPSPLGSCAHGARAEPLGAASLRKAIGGRLWLLPHGARAAHSSAQLLRPYLTKNVSSRYNEDIRHKRNSLHSLVFFPD